MINLTPHTVTVRDEHDVDHIYPPSGHVARVEMRTNPCGTLPDGCPVIRVNYGKATLPLLPLPEGVSRVLCRDRSDGHEYLIHVRVPEGCTAEAGCDGLSDYWIDLIDRFGGRKHVEQYLNSDYDNPEYSTLIARVDTHYIVSTMFAAAYKDQHPYLTEGVLFTPDSGPTAIRKDGAIVAVRALIRH
jgi:hypothetical protein